MRLGGSLRSDRRGRTPLRLRWQKLEKIKKLDFYGAPLCAEAESRLKKCETILDAYAQRVVEANDENK